MNKASPDGIRPGAIFSRYQKFVIAVLAFLQFTIILDFMIISPLGAMMEFRGHYTERVSP